MCKGSSAVMVAAFLVLVPSLASAEMATAAAGKPLLLAQVTPPPLPQPPSVQYFYNDNGKPAGPLTLAEIRARIAAGAIKPETLVWKTGLPGWVAAKEVTEIAAIFAGGPPPIPAPKPGPAPSPSRTPVASDCTGKVLLSDDFKQVDGSWDLDANSDKVTVEDGKLKVKSDANGHFGFSYKGRPFGEADYCVTVQTPNNAKDAKDSKLLAGLSFWEVDGNNGFIFLVAPQGGAALGRIVDGKWTTVAGFREFEAVKKGAGAKNMLRVATGESSIITYVNGQKFASVRAQAPSGGGLVGFWVHAEKDSGDTWKFFDLRVTERSR